MYILEKQNIFYCLVRLALLFSLIPSKGVGVSHYTVPHNGMDLILSSTLGAAL